MKSPVQPRNQFCGIEKAALILALFLPLPALQAATQDGPLKMEVITAYNFVVDSNVESPSSYSPSAAHLGVKIRNTGATALTNVTVNIGDLLNPLTSSGTPGVFPSRTVSVTGAKAYSGTFALQMPGGAADAVRVIPSIGPGESVVQYFFVTYPLKDPAGHGVAGAAADPTDDLWLNYDIWASATDGASTRRVDETTKVTMRNEISAMANKIWPNTTSKVPDNYLNAIQASLGWRPDSNAPRSGATAQLEGIWYDLGNVGAGFDNNGDGIPDRNAWMQPVGDPGLYDPLVMRLVKCYGLLIVKVNDGTEKLIPFEDQLYFENIPGNNTGAVGLVYYEFMPLAAGRRAALSPYQEVASGFDNEKFNGDYGAATVGFTATAPDVTFVKTGPTLVAGGGTATYTLSAANTGTSGIGLPGLSLPFVFEDGVPSGLLYVAGSATSSNTIPAGNTVAVSWSTDNGATWVTTAPAAASVTRIRWTLAAALAAGTTATVGFQASVPVAYPSLTIDNTGVIKLGATGSLATDRVTTLLSGINSLGDLVWKDDNRNSAKDAAESGIPNITMRLYVDANANNALDASDPLYGTTQTNASGIYSFTNLPDGRFLVVVDDADPDLPAGYTLPNSATAVISVSLDPAHATSTAVSVLTADWPFIGALAVVKSVSPTTYGAGDLITYTLDLENYSSPVAAKISPVQTSWSSTVTGNRAAQNAASAQGAPDNSYARIDAAANADNLANNAVTFPSPTGTITKVEFLFNAYASLAYVDDRMDLFLNGSGTAFKTFTTAELNAMTGISALRAIDITSLNTTWTWALVQAVTGNLKINKTSAGDAAILWVDSMGFRVTTSAVAPSTGTYGPSSLAPLPLTDTYDATKLQYVSASIAPTSSSPGTLTWTNLGPLNAGARTSLDVVFRALTPPDINGNGEPDPTTTINTATSTGALFVSGRPANSSTGTATVTINPRGSIGDLIWWDINADGIRDAAEPGLANVLVNLSNGAQTRTDASGYYLFPGLVNGTYTVTVVTSTLPWSTGNFTQTKDPDGAVKDNASTVTINNSDGISTNDKYLDRDFGYDSAQNVISGTIFQDNSGNGVRESGENFLAGLTVTLSGAASAATTTDSLGFYQFAALANGTYTVTVTTVPASATQTLDPDATVNNATTVVTSGGNLYPNRDFAYKPAGSLTLGDTLYLDWNGNGAQDAGDAGIVSVDVFLYEDSDGNGAIDPATDALIATSVTNATGVYGFTGLAAARYIVVVNTADPQFPAGVVQTQDYDGTRDNQAAVNLTASLATADFGYQPRNTGSIGDTVFLDADGNGIKGASESGIGSVGVTLYHDTNNNGVIDAGTDAVVATTTTSASGSYLFTGLAPGDYLVDVDQNAASIPSDAYGNKFRPTTVDPHDVMLSAGQAYLIADFGFAAAASIGDFVFFDSNANGGLDFSETGIPNVTVQLFPDANQDGLPDSTTPVATTVTASGSGVNPAGFYQFTGVAAGTYFVKVLTTTLPQSGGQPIPLTSDPDRDGVPVGNNTYPGLPAGDNADSLVIVSLGSNYLGADFGYKPPGAIGDFVWLDLDHDGVQDAGEPGLAGVTIAVSNGSTTYTATTDFDGYWSLANVPDGSWTASVPASNFAPGGALEATINTFDASGPANSSAAFVLTNGTVNLATGNLGIDFGYALNGSLGISGTVLIHDTGAVGTADDVDDFFDDGVDMDAGPQDETELPGIVVHLYSTTGDFLGSTVTDARGHYSFTGLPGGGYRVIIGTTAYALAGATLTTTTATNAAVSSVNSSSGTTVIQTLTLGTTSVTRVDFAFVSTLNYDYGDLPASYGITTLTQDGARHIIPAGASVFLGTAPDADTNGIPTSLANGDDGLNTDDEDGVTPVSPATWSDGAVTAGHGGSLQVNVTGTGWLTGWVDWNHDGDFLDSGEFILSQSVTTGSTAIAFDIPGGTVGTASESWLSRFRVFTSKPAYPLFSYTGLATGGEVEDYLIERPLGASIGDRIWIDSDNSGTLDTGEAGLGGRIVELRNGGNVLLATQTTSDGTQDVDGDGVVDPVGYYRFRGLAAGTYTVTVTNPPAGYSPSYDENGTATPHSSSLSLAAGEQHLAADFGYAPMRADISGQVRYDLDADGDLSDPDAGAAFVKVQLWTDPNGDGNPADGLQIRETYTGGTGRYLFASVATGNYVVVEVNLAGSTSTADVNPPNNDRIGVALAGTSSTGNDFLDTVPPLYSINGAVYEDANATNDNVIGVDDTPVGFIPVALYFDRDGSGTVTAGDALLSTTSTISTGAYQFANLPPGQYVVQESDPAGAVSDWDSQGSLTDNQIAVTIVNADAVNRNFLDDGIPLGNIGDYIWNDANGDGVQDNNERPLSGVKVFIDLNNDGIRDANEPFVTTSSTGAYVISNLITGTYTVVLDPATRPAGTSVTGDPDATKDGKTSVTLAAGQTLTTADFGLQGNGSIGDYVWNDANGDGVQGVTELPLPGVKVFLDLDNDGIRDANEPFATTSGTGAYLLSGLIPGTYTVAVEVSTLPAGATPTYDLDGTATANRAFVALAAGQALATADFGYQAPAFTISGQVTDGANPIPGVTVTLKNAGGVVIATTVTGGDGRYSFSGLPDGAYTVVETNPPGTTGGSDVDGGNPDEISVTISGVSVPGRDFVDLNPTLSAISGFVYDDGTPNDNAFGAGDLPVGGVTVRLYKDLNGNGIADASEFISSTVTGTNGGYSFPALSSGGYLVVESNPPGAVSEADTQGANDDKVAIALAGAGSTGNNFLDDGVTTYAISGQVRDDYDGDGNFSDNDTPVGGVIITLYADVDGDGVLDAGEPVMGTTRTSQAGAYSFSNLVAGKYIVRESDPAGANSTADTAGVNDNNIAVTISGANSPGNDFLDQVDPTGYFYAASSGRIIPGGSISVSGPGGVTIIMSGVTGQYSFVSDGTPGTYILSITPPAGYVIDPSRPAQSGALVPAGQPSPYTLGSGENPANPGYLTSFTAPANPYYLSFTLAPGDPLVINNNIPLIQTKASTWAEWQYQNPLGGQNGPGQNPDGDLTPNLLEFAFCYNPRNGVPRNPAGGRGFCLVQNGSGGMNVEVIRPIGFTGLTYTLEYTGALGTPTTWTANNDLTGIVPAIVNNGNGFETVRWADLDNLPALSAGQGYGRIRVDEASSGATAYTEVQGWLDHPIARQCETCSNPFLKKELFSGTGDAGSPANAINVAGSAVGTNVATLLAGKECLFVEVISGVLEGQRFAVDAAGSDADTIALVVGNAMNTQTPIPDLSGAAFVVREMWRFGDLFPASLFQSGGDLNTSDNLLSFNPATQTWTTWFLADLGGFGTYWVDSGDTAGPPVSQNGRCMDPSEGLFVHRRGAPLTVPLLGVVRENDFACPLKPAYTLLGGGYPQDQSYLGRGMTLANGFNGDVDIRMADQVLFWAGDATPGQVSYRSHYLLDAGPPYQRWISAGDSFATPQDANALFKAGRAAFICSGAGLPGYKVNAPWVP